MAKVIRLNIIQDESGSIGIYDSFFKTEGKGSVAFQNRKNGVVITKKTAPTYKRTEKQDIRRNLFCEAERLYNKLNDAQKKLFKIYTDFYNKRTGENLSPPALWKRLLLSGKLDYFLEKYLNLKFDEVKQTEEDDKICYTTRIIPQDYEGILEDIFTDMGAVRR